jgi:hypothetical protein
MENFQTERTTKGANNEGIKSINDYNFLSVFCSTLMIVIQGSGGVEHQLEAIIAQCKAGGGRGGKCPTLD